MDLALESPDRDIDFIRLTRDLCRFRTAVVADGNEDLFARIAEEVPVTLHRYASGSEFNGWVIPDNWHVRRALIRKDGQIVFDGSCHALAVGYYSRSFKGVLDWEDLKPHLVSNPALPDAIMFHCNWQYRPWEADWVFSIPHRVREALGPGRYEIDLETSRAPGEMIVGECLHRGRSNQTVVFQTNTCHPHMANDGFAGSAVMIRLFQWLRRQDTHYTYQLLMGPEHLGTVFYLRNRSFEEMERYVGGIFGEMMGTGGAFKLASSFLGDQAVDRAMRHAVKQTTSRHEFVPWRCGAGNDETVWEAPGYEVPFIEANRAEFLERPYREYHSSLDTADLMQHTQLQEFYDAFCRFVFILENEARLYRNFDGLICLSNPKYGLYFERHDPTIDKGLTAETNKWGALLDSLFRYMDGSTTILDIAEKHDLPFDLLLNYVRRLEAKGLIDIEFAPIQRAPISRPRRRRSAGPV